MRDALVLRDGRLRDLLRMRLRRRLAQLDRGGSRVDLRAQVLVEVEGLGELAQELALLDRVRVDRETRSGIDLSAFLRVRDAAREFLDARRRSHLALEPASRLRVDAGLGEALRDAGAFGFVDLPIR